MDESERVQLHVPGGDVSDQLTDHVRRRFAFSGEQRVHVTVQDSPDGGHETRVRTIGTGAQLVASASNRDIFASVDAAASRLKAQLRGRHERRSDHQALPARGATSH